MPLKNTFGDGCGMEKNNNKQVFLPIMSFFSSRAICYLLDQFNVRLLIIFIKTPAMLKRQRFNDSESKKITSRKRQQFNEHNNKKRQNLDKNKSELEGDKYIPLPLFAFFFPLEKESNRLSDLCKGTKSLIHLIWISKNGQSERC